MADITLDPPLMAYLFDGVIPRSPAVLERCARTSRWLRVDAAMGDLVMVQSDGRRRWVPLIGEREGLLRRVHAEMAYCSGQRLHQRILASYYWNGLKRDCERIARKSLPNQRERAQFLPPPYLLPTFKGHRPLAEWAIDLMQLRPPTEDGRTGVAVAVDAFTKWVEAGVLPDRSS